MKKLFGFILFLAVVFGGSYVGSRWIEPKSKSILHAASDRFKPTQFPLKNRSFAIVIVGANNGAVVEKTLRSIFSQNYENYRIIYVDDGSNDGSFDLVKDLVYDGGRFIQVELVQNPQKLGTLASLFKVIGGCEDGEIVVLLGGEDQLAHEWVLQRLNAYYANPDLWLTYGQYVVYPGYQKGICQDYLDQKFRCEPFSASHLKTFYAALFKKIKESDLSTAGKFLPAAADLAYMIPMLEMAKDHYQFIPEVLYVSNRQIEKIEDLEMQVRCEKYIRSLDAYPPLAALKVEPCGK